MARSGRGGPPVGAITAPAGRASSACLSGRPSPPFARQHNPYPKRSRRVSTAVPPMIRALELACRFVGPHLRPRARNAVAFIHSGPFGGGCYFDSHILLRPGALQVVIPADTGRSTLSAYRQRWIEDDEMVKFRETSEVRAGRASHRRAEG